MLKQLDIDSDTESDSGNVFLTTDFILSDHILSHTVSSLLSSQPFSVFSTLFIFFIFTTIQVVLQFTKSSDMFVKVLEVAVSGFPYS